MKKITKPGFTNAERARFRAAESKAFANLAKEFEKYLADGAVGAFTISFSRKRRVLEPNGKAKARSINVKITYGPDT